MDLITNGSYYKHFLKSAEFPYTESEKNCIRSTVTQLMNKETLGSRPGMLLGKIQSGKTKTFLAIIGVAFDNGYEVAVVLTKGTKALSKQTQERIQREFKPFCDNDDVLVFDIMQMPQSLSGWEKKKKMIFVVKKQKDNLARLLTLFSEKDAELSQKKALIIDDEADYASVGYKRKEGEIDTNVTSVKLDQLRTKVKDASFLQVTATPYSLYLQPEDVEIRGEEFMPVRPAFTVLVPVNDAYVGSDYYFDDTDEFDNAADWLLVPLGQSELSIIKKMDGRRFKIEDVLKSDAIIGLRSAFCNFIVGGAIRQMQIAKSRSPSRKFSFLVHTEVSKASHQWQEKIVNMISDKLQIEAKKRSELFALLVNESCNELKPSIEMSGYYMPPIEELMDRTREILIDGELTITSINSDKQVESLLDESGQLKLRTPFNIFIGGQILDRGITIGNLIGFYYGRKPNKFQQDTVLQHSRMYGYRPKEDLAVTRFYTEPSIYAAMKRIHESDVALREEIEKNPNQKVVFIQGSTGGTVIPCSPNKIMLSETTTLKPYKRILPVGFQTDCKTRTQPVTDTIDQWLFQAHTGKENDDPFKITKKLAHNILKELEKIILMEEEEGYSFDWNGMHAAIDYMAGRSSDQEHIWCLWRTDRNNARFAGVGSHTVYVATPDTATTEGAIARNVAKDTPMLMLFRQNGEKEKDWKGVPFYWPVLIAPGNTRIAIYANETTE